VPTRCRKPAFPRDLVDGVMRPLLRRHRQKTSTLSAAQCQSCLPPAVYNDGQPTMQLIAAHVPGASE